MNRYKAVGDELRYHNGVVTKNGALMVPLDINEEGLPCQSSSRSPRRDCDENHFESEIVVAEHVTSGRKLGENLQKLYSDFPEKPTGADEALEVTTRSLGYAKSVHFRSGGLFVAIPHGKRSKINGFHFSRGGVGSIVPQNRPTTENQKHEYKEYCGRRNIEDVFVIPLHPQQNGML